MHKGIADYKVISNILRSLRNSGLDVSYKEGSDVMSVKSCGQDIAIKVKLVNDLIPVKEYNDKQKRKYSDDLFDYGQLDKKEQKEMGRPCILNYLRYRNNGSEEEKGYMYLGSCTRTPYYFKTYEEAMERIMNNNLLLVPNKREDL